MINPNRLVPVDNCWVLHSNRGQGLVSKSFRGSDGVSLKVKWREAQGDTTMVPLSDLRSGFTVGMEVQHKPVLKIEQSLGEGIVLKTRTLAGADQVLVDFFELGESRWLPYETLSWIKGVKHRFVTGDLGDQSSPEKFRMKILANALETWNENTGSLSRLDIDPLPHQVHLVHHILASGHLNWLIADDVGLGKTIETGMLLKALEHRGEAERILLITPAGLTKQWKEELHDKFGLSEFRIYGDDFSISESREWGMHKHVIGSIDRFKEDKHIESLLRADPWDLVVFDEAHRLSRRQYGMKYEASQRFQLANRLRNKTKGLMLLSATPHQGKHDLFQSLLMLLSPERKEEIDSLALNPEILSDMMIRNNKADVTDADGNFIFHGKVSVAVELEHSPELKLFEKSLSDYIKRGYIAASELGNVGNAIGFVMTVYRKLAASSAKAIYTALVNRRARLLNERAQFESFESQEFDERFAGEFEETAGSTMTQFFEGEIEELDELIVQSQAVILDDRKMQAFIKELIPQVLRSNPNEKLLVFTEYRSTQDYLKAELEKAYPSSGVSLINGSIPLHARREQIRLFESANQFLISTEAGGEGINLQRECHIIINYDLPWNPMRLVQRIGRLYRYGQEKKVIVCNLHSPESADDHIIDLMYERIDQVVQDLATVAGEYNERLAEDILGQIADMVDLEGILLEADKEGVDRTQERIDEALQRARDASLMQRDLFAYSARFNPDAVKDELAISHEHLVSFVRGMFGQLDVEVLDETYKGQVWQIRLPESVAAELGVRKTRYEITFDRSIFRRKPNVEMMDLDNFIFNYLLSKAKSFDFGGLSASMSSRSLDGTLVVCSFLRWQDQMGRRQRQELVALQVDSFGRTATNSDEFSKVLLEPAEHVVRSVQTEKSAQAWGRLEIEASEILAAKSTKHLQPQGNYPVAAALYAS